MHRIDGQGATEDGKFTEGNASTGLPATTVTADWCNALQEEVINVLTAAGINPAKANNGQLLAAILSLISGGGVAVTASGVTIADTGDYFAFGDVENALQQLAEKVYRGTLNAGQIRRNVTILTGTNHGASLNHAESIVQISSPTTAGYTINPDSTSNPSQNFPNGTAIEVVQIGAGKVFFNPGPGVQLLYPSNFRAFTLGQHATAVLYKVGDNVWRLGGMLEPAA